MRFIKKNLIIFGLVLGVFLNGFLWAQPVKDKDALNRGVWVSVFSPKSALYSKEGVLSLIKTCKKASINQIYLQLYQSGNAYYDSKIDSTLASSRVSPECNRRTKRGILSSTDIISFLLEEAQKNKIKVFAWLNILSLGKNDKADILLKFGNSILTRDQYLRTGANEKNELDKYYLVENQFFLEPGDPRVEKYIASIIDEILQKYPRLSGIHLDYVRYPAIVPFVWGSRFNKYGLTYGYGGDNLRRFKEKTGLDPMNSRLENDDYLVWDNWKREQISGLVRRLSMRIKKKSSELLVSCAVIPGVERAYLSYFQDWPSWLSNGIVDYVVLMNYTRDDALAQQITKAALAFRANAKIFIGLGVFLMKDEPERFLRQYKLTADFNPDGIVFFSYDDLSDEMIENIKK